VTLNLGLRYEFFTVRRTKTAWMLSADVRTSPDPVWAARSSNPSLGNVAPRVGFAWDVGGDGRTAIRGGGGLYHDTDGPYNSTLSSRPSRRLRDVVKSARGDSISDARVFHCDGRGHAEHAHDGLPHQAAKGVT